VLLSDTSFDFETPERTGTRTVPPLLPATDPFHFDKK
jgi:hypothetical protein